MYIYFFLQVYFKGANVEGDSSIKWATEKVMYVKGGETTNFKWVNTIATEFADRKWILE